MGGELRLGRAEGELRIGRREELRIGLGEELRIGLGELGFAVGGERAGCVVAGPLLV